MLSILRQRRSFYLSRVWYFSSGAVFIFAVFLFLILGHKITMCMVSPLTFFFTFLNIIKVLKVLTSHVFFSVGGTSLLRSVIGI